MKKRFFYLCSLLFVTGAMMSCSSDDDKIDDGSENTSDVAVTGLPSEIGTSYACLNGYVNLNLLPPGISNPTIGIELHNESDLGEKDYWKGGGSKTTQEIEGNKFTIIYDGLESKRTFKYRSFVAAGNLSYYGEYRTFTTKDFSNITSTGEASDITFTSATVTATADIESINPKEDFGIGIAYSTDKSMLHPDSIFNKKACYLDEVKENSYSVTLSSLLTGTNYYYCSYTRVGDSDRFADSYKLGAIKSFKTKSLDGQLTTGNATDITFTSAALSGTSTIASLYPKGKSISYGFRYALSKDALEGITIPEGYINYGNGYYYNPQTGDYISIPTNSSKTVSANIENNVFTAKLTGLNANKTYYYHTYAKVDGAELTGEVKSFTTKSLDGYLSIEEAEDVTFTSATIKGKTTLESLYKDSYPTIRYQLQYATNKSYLEYSYDWDYVTPTLSSEILTASLNRLNEGTTYYYRLQVQVDGTYLYSDIKEFETKYASDYYLSTGDATNITMTTAKVEGITKLSEIYPSTSSITYYVHYATSVSNLESSYSSNRKSVTASKDGDNLKASISNLSSNQTYYYRVVAYVDNEYVYGATRSFTTKSEKDYLSTGEATNITMTTADIAGTTTLSDIYPSSSLIEYYVHYATDRSYFTYSTSHRKSVTAIKEKNNLKATLPNLTIATTYYYCIVASVNGIQILSDIKSFTTKDLQTTGYVDLGLSCKWAACNLGASTPESTGEFYGWGDVESRTFFYSSNNTNYDKDIGTDISGTDYDAARKILDSPWRIPTREEFQELLNKCLFQEIIYKNTTGYLVTGKNENVIFIPKTGYKQDRSNYSGYCYWTSTKYNYSTFPNRYAYAFVGSFIDYKYRYYGCTIRPVQD
ncbi:MAG: fibronectin type III domain-containing protein [Bacteroidaceae bacterium]|nr:fibronectin type III domain-containing protein [Bacteroidaceae bacterium]